MNRLSQITFILSLGLFLLFAILALAYWSLNDQIDNDIRRVVSKNSRDRNMVTKEMVTSLPDPVQRYLFYTGVVDKPIPNVIYLKQIGKIRKDAKSSWMTIEAQQYYSTNPPNFVWKAFMPKMGLPVVLGRDKYFEGEGSILMKFGALFPVADQKGEQMNEASLTRYLNEMMWFPQSFLGDNISWKAIDENSAEVILTDRGKSVKATLYFDKEGRLTNFSAPRYNTEAGKVETWETPITKYGEFEGLKLPIEGKAVYRRIEGDLEYINVTVINLRYD